MFWLIVAVQWVHVVLAIFWFGSVLYVDIVLVPVVLRLPSETQAQIAAPLGVRSERIYPPLAGLVMLFGIIRGIAGGVLGQLTSAYGLTWLAAIVVTGFLAFLAIRILGPDRKRLQTTPAGPELTALIKRAQAGAVLELALFFVIISMMIAMHFGY